MLDREEAPTGDRLGRYAVITPVRDEVENLAQLAASLQAQSLRPLVWIIVDNGSTDGTIAVAKDLVARQEWVRLTNTRGGSVATPGAPIVRAFHAGLRKLDDEVDVVVKVDADVTMGPEHFRALLGAFSQNPHLGLAGGRCYELENGVWQPARVTGNHVRGAVRAYRRQCLDQLLPLPERTGWDTIDEYQARALGWEAQIVESIRFQHHRPVGARDGEPSRRWRTQGAAAHYLGYRPLYLTLRAFYNAIMERDVRALAMLRGYASSAVRRRAQHPDTAARALLQRQQRLRQLRRRGQHGSSSREG